MTVPPRGAADHGAREAFADGKEPLMRCLPVRTVFKCVAAIACERRLLLRSKQVSLLVKCAEALRGLAHPLVWRHVYIPCLPISMVDYLDAPMPFIMGATHDVDVDERALEGVTVVDLDTGSMRDGGEQILLPQESMLRNKCVLVLARRRFVAVHAWKICSRRHRQEETREISFDTADRRLVGFTRFYRVSVDGLAFDTASSYFEFR